MFTSNCAIYTLIPISPIPPNLRLQCPAMIVIQWFLMILSMVFFYYRFLMLVRFKVVSYPSTPLLLEMYPLPPSSHGNLCLKCPAMSLTKWFLMSLPTALLHRKLLVLVRFKVVPCPISTLLRTSSSCFSTPTKQSPKEKKNCK